MNKVNARTRHVITRLRASGMTRLPCDMRMKTIDTGDHVRSHCSYLVNTVELCFYDMLDFFVFFLTR